MSELSKLTAKAARLTGVSRRTFYRMASNGVDIRKEINTIKPGMWWKPSEVANLLKVSRSTVYRWIESGIFEYIRIGNSIRIASFSLDIFIQNGRIER